jgi:hypothetical protein
MDRRADGQGQTYMPPPLSEWGHKKSQFYFKFNTSVSDISVAQYGKVTIIWYVLLEIY